VENGSLDNAAKSEVLETAKEILRVKSTPPASQIFDFSLTEEAK